jgi:lipoic acid synthetase
MNKTPNDPRQRDRSASAADKVARIPVKIAPTTTPLRKPEWIRARIPSGDGVSRVRSLIRENALHTVCEEANCPNLGECFHHGTATFMILGGVCTRRCPFCDVAHGKPLPPDVDEPAQLAHAVTTLNLRYVVLTSVDRDDLRDGGAQHFVDCINALRQASPSLTIEVLTPDFRGRETIALEALTQSAPDVFNHNLETVPRLYRAVRPGADYSGSLQLLQDFGTRFSSIPTKSGIMLGLGEELDEVREVMRDLRAHNVSMLTLGQYLQPTRNHLPVERYVHPDEFEQLRIEAEALGFTSVASGPLVRSSYHADLQAAGGRVS